MLPGREAPTEAWLKGSDREGKALENANVKNNIKDGGDVAWRN